MKRRHLIWRKSPLPILLFLSVLLLALGHFETVARRLRNQDLVIEITPEAQIVGTNGAQFINFETEQFPQAVSEGLSSWFDRIETEPLEQIRS